MEFVKIAPDYPFPALNSKKIRFVTPIDFDRHAQFFSHSYLVMKVEFSRPPLLNTQSIANDLNSPFFLFKEIQFCVDGRPIETIRDVGLLHTLYHMLLLGKRRGRLSHLYNVNAEDLNSSSTTSGCVDNLTNNDGKASFLLPIKFVLQCCYYNEVVVQNARFSFTIHLTDETRNFVNGYSARGDTDCKFEVKEANLYVPCTPKKIRLSKMLTNINFYEIVKHEFQIASSAAETTHEFQIGTFPTRPHFIFVLFLKKRTNTLPTYINLPDRVHVKKCDLIRNGRVEQSRRDIGREKRVTLDEFLQLRAAECDLKQTLMKSACTWSSFDSIQQTMLATSFLYFNNQLRGNWNESDSAQLDQKTNLKLNLELEKQPDKDLTCYTYVFFQKQINL